MREHMGDLEKELNELENLLEKDPDNTDLLYRHAVLLQKAGRYGDAINDLQQILELNPGHKRAGERLHFLETILKFTNMDIFSDTNTHHDPWLE